MLYILSQRVLHVIKATIAAIAVSLLVLSIYIARCAPPWLDLDTEPCQIQYGYLVVSIYWSHWTHATPCNIFIILITSCFEFAGGLPAKTNGTYAAARNCLSTTS